MFEMALRRAGVREGSIGLHIGDNFKRDILGARGVGWRSILITDSNPDVNEQSVDHVRVPHLKHVPEVLGLNRT